MRSPARLSQPVPKPQSPSAGGPRAGPGAQVASGPGAGARIRHPSSYLIAGCPKDALAVRGNRAGTKEPGVRTMDLCERLPRLRRIEEVFAGLRFARAPSIRELQE
jgi:hypothetical protein